MSVRSARRERVAAIRASRERPSPIDLDAPARLLGEQRLGRAVAAGSATALAGAVGWVWTAFESDWAYVGMAFAIGAGCGLAVRHSGRGVESVFGFVAGGVAALACLVGEILLGAVAARTIAFVLIAGYAAHWSAFRETTEAEDHALWRHRMGVLDR